MESPELILSESGNPFKTEGAARAAMHNKKMSGDDYNVVPCNSGFAISRYENAPEPAKDHPPTVSRRMGAVAREKTYRSIFSTYDEGYAFIDSQEISQEFKDQIKIQPLETEDGGFRLILPKWMFFTERDAQAFKTLGQMPEKMVKIVQMDGGGYKIVERYWKVRFNARSAPHEEEQVILAVQGETLTMQREKEVILPESFLECADHTRYPKFTQIPGEKRKRVSYIQTFPYQRIEESTGEEFIKQKEAGTKKTKQDIEKYGFDVDPEAIE